MIIPTQSRFKNVMEFARWWDSVRHDSSFSLPADQHSPDVTLQLEIATNAEHIPAICIPWKGLWPNERVDLVLQARNMGLLALAE